MMLKIVRIVLIACFFVMYQARVTLGYVVVDDYDESEEFKDFRSIGNELNDLQNQIEPMYTGGVSEFKKSTEDDQKTLKTLKVLLEGLRNRGSTFKSVPYSPDVVDKYVNGYLKQIDVLSKKMKPSSELNVKRFFSANKKAVCGSLNGNPSYRWICW